MVSIDALTQDMLLKAHETTAVPSVIILYVVMMLSLFLCGLFIARSSGKFWSIFFLVLIVGAIAMAGIIYMPNAVQAIWGIVVGP